ncbi:hypothetical protein [Ancylobacter sp.]|uniref:hypothetical protein n=1 Tax=Ancylobacter sp. TaxID=1872567 RepID=UPI003D0D3262
MALASPLALLGTADAQSQTASPGETAAPAQPLVLLLDGLGVYVESDLIGVSALTRPLAEQGFRTRTDSHLMLKTKGVVPDVIVGHSMGGETALRYAGELARAGYKPPLVITIDAAPAPPACTVPRCINIAGPGFARVRGAENVSAWAAGAQFRNHAQLPTHPAVQQIILKETASWMAAWRAQRQTLARSDRKPAKPAAAGRAPAAAAPSPSSPSTSTWTVPGWSVPGWTVPSWPGLSRQGG